MPAGNLRPFNLYLHYLKFQIVIYSDDTVPPKYLHLIFRFCRERNVDSEKEKLISLSHTGATFSFGGVTTIMRFNQLRFINEGDWHYISVVFDGSQRQVHLFSDRSRDDGAVLNYQKGYQFPL